MLAVSLCDFVELGHHRGTMVQLPFIGLRIYGSLLRDLQAGDDLHGCASRRSSHGRHCTELCSISRALDLAVPHSYHTLVGFDTEPVNIRVLRNTPSPISREDYALRSDSPVAQIAMARAGFGIGGNADFIARQGSEPRTCAS
jgi:hypothetical protein